MISSVVRSSPSMRRTYVLGLTLLLAACSASDDGGVQWGDYTPGLQGRINALGAAGDCPSLQDEFDAADANNAATQSRTGHNNAELMTYIDGVMRDAGCYDG